MAIVSAKVTFIQIVAPGLTGTAIAGWAGATGPRANCIGTLSERVTPSIARKALINVQAGNTIASKARLAQTGEITGNVAT